MLLSTLLTITPACKKQIFTSPTRKKVNVTFLWWLETFCGFEMVGVFLGENNSHTFLIMLLLLLKLVLLHFMKLLKFLRV